MIQRILTVLYLQIPVHMLCWVVKLVFNMKGYFLCQCGDGLTYFDTADLSCLGFVFVKFIVCGRHLLSKQNKIMTLMTGYILGTGLCPFLMLYIRYRIVSLPDAIYQVQDCVPS